MEQNEPSLQKSVSERQESTQQSTTHALSKSQLPFILAVIVLLLFLGATCIYYVTKYTNGFSSNLSTIPNSPRPSIIEDVRYQASLKTWDDGTAFVTGQIEEHNVGCTLDGTCYLKLRVDNEEVRVLYDQGEGTISCVNIRAAKNAQTMKKGDWVKAFGSYIKKGKFSVIYTCDSTDYFIVSADKGIPIGPVTDRFFDKALEDKAKENEKESKQQGWQTYKESKLKYEFQYPANWSMPQTAAQTSSDNLPFTIYHDEKEKGTWHITVGYIPQSQLALMGVTYCGSSPHDSSRCESRTVGGVNTTIDWGIKDETRTKASVWIPHSKGGVVTFELQPVIPETKTVLYQILSTFKFT